MQVNMCHDKAIGGEHLVGGGKIGNIGESVIEMFP